MELDKTSYSIKLKYDKHFEREVLQCEFSFPNTYLCSADEPFATLGLMSSPLKA